MSKPVYLFKEHQDFQVGKTSLQRGAVFETNFYWLMFWLSLSLFGMWLGGSHFNQIWNDSQVETVTTARVLSCEIRHTKNGPHIALGYAYSVNNINYQASDTYAPETCDDFPSGSAIEIYYLSAFPNQSSVVTFFAGFIMARIFGVFGMFFIFAFLIKNRHELQVYARFRKATIVMEASIIEVGEVTGKGGYKFAKYEFPYPEEDAFVGEIVSGDTLITLTKGYKIQGQIRTGKQYRFPKDIQVGDKLQILYISDKLFCAL